MHTQPIHQKDGGLDPAELDRHIAEMYRDVANEADTERLKPTTTTQEVSQ